MATSTNFLKYTGLDYSSILKSVTDKLKADPRFDNFRESAIAQTINEIFTGTADLTNYYIQRQAEESFFETSQRDSSAILNSRNLAYDITRPIPATTTIKINIKGDMRSRILTGRKLQIPVFSKFTYNGNDFILKKGVTYTFTSTDAEEVITQGTSYDKTFSVDDDGDPITLIQGTLKLKIIVGETNPQIGQIFQTYRIPDVTFSNYYGNADLTDYPTTRVWVGADQSDNNEFVIDRRSLLNNDVLHSILAGQTIKCALIRTAVDNDIELKFGTVKIASIGANVNTGGPETTFDNIYIQYLSTIGTKANQVGIIDEIITCSNQIIVNSFNITSNVQFKFASNIIGGSDIETQESIKVNAPSIFYSLDRAVNNPDHVNILKSLTSPIKIKNAISWGEQEEAKARNVAAIVELFNIGFFTCVGSVYNVEGDIATDTFSVRTNDNRIDEAVLDDNFDENAMSSQYYFNVFVKDMIARQVKEQIVGIWFWWINNYVPMDSDKTAVYFKTTYPNDITIDYTYTSDTYLSGTEAIDNITINLSAISAIDDIATAIQTELRANVDTRSSIVGGIQTNTNYGLPQFSNITVEWQSENKKFLITNATTDACYLYSLDPTSSQDIMTDLGLHDASAETDPAIAEKIYINQNSNYVSSKITEVLNYMYEKGMITLKYIYVSPLIQSFRAVGTVYVDQLFSTDDLKKQANNNAYVFLDDNADFNVPINKSNIIQIIEDLKGINHVDIRFEPDIPYPVLDPIYDPSYRSTFYFPKKGYYEPIDKYATQADIIYLNINFILNSYFPIIFDEPDWRSFIEWTRTLTPDEIHEDASRGISAMTSRKFLSNVVKDMYDLLKNALGESTPTIAQFQDTNDFITVVSDIYKDLLWVIRSNMIDSNGNIAPEYVVTTNSFGVKSKTLLRGGFSLGNELAKINFDAVSVSTQSPYLTYEYK